MKKYILVAVVLILSLSTKAQLSVGVRQGVGVHGVYFEPLALGSQYQVPYLRYNTGLVCIFTDVNNTGIQVEFNYAQKGWREEDSKVEDSYFTRNIDYLEIPILSHFELFRSKFRPVINVGPYFALKIHDSSDSLNYSHIWNEGHPFDHFEQKIKVFDFGVKASFGFSYTFSSKIKIFADIRYDMEMIGSRNIFIDYPNEIEASRLKEFGGVFGITWSLIPQKEKDAIDGYTPKEDLY